ncbi:MAG: CHAT domain-containing protein [Cyanophyceae cyanobacterium]
MVMLYRRCLSAVSPLSAALLGAIATNGLYPLPQVSAQVSITPATDEISTQVDQQNNVFTITGGQRSQDGLTLFHSFGEFNLNARETARFVNAVETDVVLGRIIGGNPSHIDGLIQMVGNPADLYLLNLAGIIFGPNASLDLPKTFIGSTATGVGLEDFQGNIRWFDVFGSSAVHEFSGYPSILRFEVENPGSVANFGTLHIGESDRLWLVGGSVLQAGVIRAPLGDVVLASVRAYQRLRLGRSASVFDIRIQDSSPPSMPLPVAPLDLPTLLTGAEGIRPAAAVSVTSQGQIILQDSTLGQSASGSARGATTVVDSPQGSTILSGIIDVSGSSQNLSDFGAVVVTGQEVYLTGATIDARSPTSAGIIILGSDVRDVGSGVETERIFVDQGSVIDASALELGNGGIVTITATEEARFLGHLTADGGAIAGNGGIALISGDKQPTAISLNATNGQPGILTSPDTDLGESVGAGLTGLSQAISAILSFVEFEPIFDQITEDVDPRNAGEIAAVLESLDATPLGQDFMTVSAMAVENLNAADAILADAFNSVSAFTVGDNRREADIASLMLSQQTQVLATINGNPEQVRQELGDSLDTLTAAELVGGLEQLRAAEYSDHWGVSYQTPVIESSVDSIQTVLQGIARNPGKTAAVVYAFIHNDDLALTLVLPNGESKHHRFKGVVPSLLAAHREMRWHVTNPLQDSPEAYQQPAQDLYQLLLAPFRQKLDQQGVELLLFSLDSGLRSLPVAALHDGEQYLIEHYAVAIIPSFGLLETQYKPLADAKVLVAGASRFDALGDLPSVPVEAAAIGENWPTVKLMEEDFTLDAMQAARRESEFAIAHLATHAVFRDGDPSNSFVQLWGNERLTLDAIASLNFHSPPLELLVLSACQTAFGTPSAELGFAGISVQSGAKSVVASLWQVSDAGTSTLMAEFYKRLGDIPTKAEALRQAQLAILRSQTSAAAPGARASNKSLLASEVLLSPSPDIDLTHPYFWSGFALVGSPW